MAESETLVQAKLYCEAMPLQVIMMSMTIGMLKCKVNGTNQDIEDIPIYYTFFWGRVISVDLRNLEKIIKGSDSNEIKDEFRTKLQGALHPQFRSKRYEESRFSMSIDLSYDQVDQIGDAVRRRRDVEEELVTESWLKEMIKKKARNRKGINRDEFYDLLKTLNIDMKDKHAKKLFKAANTKDVNEKLLDPDEFIVFYRSYAPRPELEEIMRKYSANNLEQWNITELQNFLKKEQNMDLSLAECEELMEKDESDNPSLSLKGFQRLLLSPVLNILNQDHRIVYQDMSQPLSHYYIASSHNTYLEGRQVFGDSDTASYVQALERGCRCLELDTWDGSDGEPKITHGNTMTDSIELKEVLRAIKRYAFRASQYPLILSIENHCTLPYQVKMAEHFKNILGEYLYINPVGDEEEEYPSPEALVGKIFIKAKKLVSPQVGEGARMAKEEFILKDEEMWEEVLRAKMAIPRSESERTDNECTRSNTHEIAQELSDLVNYFSARKFKTFQESRVCWRFNEMASFKDSTAVHLGRGQGEAFVAHNRRHFSRIYPDGTHVLSANYDPGPHWSVGSQIVALNYQTWDDEMYIYEKRFSDNGKTGYILKPKYLTDKVPYNPIRQPELNRQLHVIIRIISGQFLPKPNRAESGEVIDPFVSVRVFGHSLDKVKNGRKTDIIDDNGFNPLWNWTLNYVINVPEEAIFHFKVKDADGALNEDDFIGQFALPLSSMHEGYRVIHLEDEKGQPLEMATLFVHVQFKYYHLIEVS